MLIYLVGYDSDLGMTADDVDQTLQLLTRIDAACRIGGRAENNKLSPRSDSCLKLFRGDLEVLLDAGRHEHVGAFGQLDHLHIAYPCGSRDDDFVAGILRR